MRGPIHPLDRMGRPEEEDEEAEEVVDVDTQQGEGERAVKGRGKMNFGKMYCDMVRHERVITVEEEETGKHRQEAEGGARRRAKEWDKDKVDLDRFEDGEEWDAYMGDHQFQRRKGRYRNFDKDRNWDQRDDRFSRGYGRDDRENNQRGYDRRDEREWDRDRVGYGRDRDKGYDQRQRHDRWDDRGDRRNNDRQWHDDRDRRNNNRYDDRRDNNHDRQYRREYRDNRGDGRWQERDRADQHDDRREYQQHDEYAHDTRDDFRRRRNNQESRGGRTREDEFRNRRGGSDRGPRAEYDGGGRGNRNLTGRGNEPTTDPDYSRDGFAEGQQNSSWYRRADDDGEDSVDDQQQGGWVAGDKGGRDAEYERNEYSRSYPQRQGQYQEPAEAPDSRNEEVAHEYESSEEEDYEHAPPPPKHYDSSDDEVIPQRRRRAGQDDDSDGEADGDTYDDPYGNSSKPVSRNREHREEFRRGQNPIDKKLWQPEREKPHVREDEAFWNAYHKNKAKMPDAPDKAPETLQQEKLAIAKTNEEIAARNKLMIAQYGEKAQLQELHEISQENPNLGNVDMHDNQEFPEL